VCLVSAFFIIEYRRLYDRNISSKASVEYPKTPPETALSGNVKRINASNKGKIRSG
jgi:hypothetical protein